MSYQYDILYKLYLRFLFKILRGNLDCVQMF